ncbi:DUF4430 domain-containing protein [Isoptericola aurantiacus]|uniref:DUF4430 domain-containing protein n=1 Tax=Isoptericola aurantiacus TaxID=3377839 RepID=UPI00383AAB42
MKTLLRPTSPRLLSAAAVGVLSIGLLAGCSGDDDVAPESASSASAEASPGSTDTDEHMAENVTEFSYVGQDGETALDLLLANDPDAEVSGEGEMAYVTGIKGRTAEDGKEFWALYVDDEMAQVGAGSLETEDGQQIRWTLEKIEETE